MTVHDDAVEFGTYTTHGGWRLGLLVARSVEPGIDNGRPSSETFPIGKVSDKTGANKFATKAGTSCARVLRYYEGWERAAKAGVVPHAADLHPGIEIDLPDDKKLWVKFYRNEGPQNVKDPERLDALTAEAERRGTSPTKAKDFASNPRALQAAIFADGPTARAALEALQQRNRAGLGSKRSEPEFDDADLRSPVESWGVSRETKLRDGVGMVTDGFALIEGCIAEGDLSAEEVKLRNTAIEAAIEFAAAQAQVAL